MNCNLDRTPLTTSQLVKLAVEALTTKEVTREAAIEKVANASAEFHNPNMFLSFLLDVTKELRFAMLGRGELLLDTRVSNFVPKPERTVDQELLNFLVSRRVTAVQQ